MPEYFDFKVYGYYLYFTSHCIIECMHVHASDRKMSEAGSAKFFVMSDGRTSIEERGLLNDHELNGIQSFIKENYKEMYLKWSLLSSEGFTETAEECQQSSATYIKRRIAASVSLAGVLPSRRVPRNFAKCRFRA